MYLGFHVKYPLFLSDSNKTQISWTDFRKILKYQLLWKSVSCSKWADGRTDGRTDRQDEANSRFFAILRTRLKFPHSAHTVY